MNRYTREFFLSNGSVEDVPPTDLDGVCHQMIADAVAQGIILFCRKGSQFWALETLRDFATNRYPDELDAEDFLSEAVDQLDLQHGIYRVLIDPPYEEGIDAGWDELFFCEQGDEGGLLALVEKVSSDAAQRCAPWKVMQPALRKRNPPIPLARRKTISLEREQERLTRKMPHIQSKLIEQPSKKKQAKVAASQKQLHAIAEELDRRLPQPQ